MTITADWGREKAAEPLPQQAAKLEKVLMPRLYDLFFKMAADSVSMRGLCRHASGPYGLRSKISPAIRQFQSHEPRFRRQSMIAHGELATHHPIAGLLKLQQRLRLQWRAVHRREP